MEYNTLMVKLTELYTNTGVHMDVRETLKDLGKIINEIQSQKSKPVKPENRKIRLLRETHSKLRKEFPGFDIRDLSQVIRELESEDKSVEDVRSYNVGSSDYSKHKIQPWSIWEDYKLNPWDADIVKRVLRNKEGESRKLDYEKMIHICKERIRQLEAQ